MGKKNATDLADLGIANLATCGSLFFDELWDPAVLPTANACCRVGIDRFILSCRVFPEDFTALWSDFPNKFKNIKPLRCKRGRIRGLRAKINIKDAPHPTDASASHTAPQIAAPVTANFEIYFGQNGQYFGAHGNGRFTKRQWRRFHQILTEKFPVPELASVSRIEVYSDFPLPSDYVAVLPIGSKSRFCLQENGFYYGARASNNTLVTYHRPQRNPQAGVWTRVEARVRARVSPHLLVAQVMPVFDKYGFYLANGPFSMLHLPDAWRAADTRGRKRFLDRVEPYRLYVDKQRIKHAIDEFAQVVLPRSYL